MFLLISVPTNEAAVNSLAHLITDNGLDEGGPPNLLPENIPLNVAGISVLDPDNAINPNPGAMGKNSAVDFIWSKQTVAAGDTAVLHCSFDAIFQQLRTGNVSTLTEVMERAREGVRGWR